MVHKKMSFSIEMRLKLMELHRGKDEIWKQERTRSQNVPMMGVKEKKEFDRFDDDGIVPFEELSGVGGT
jgi:hypothetical protein